MRHRGPNKRGVIPEQTAAEIMLILYFTLPFWKWLFEQLFELSGDVSPALPFTLAVVYAPVIAVFLAARQQVPADFFFLLLYIGLYFGVTYLFHGEYEYYYTREQYGVADYVLRPDNGLYAYLFLRMVKEPERVLRGLRVSGYVIYAYSALRLYVATRKGFWMEEGSRGQEYMSSYNMNYGYTLLLFLCCYLYCALEKKNLWYLFLSAAGVFMILCGGSRGPMLDVGIFLAFYWLIRLRRSRRKPLYLAGTALLGGIAAALYRPALNALRDLTDRAGLHSRTLNMMLAGTVAQNNGRDVFWEASFQMIRENPLGYGAMGARHVLCGIHIVGHPHNVMIELLIEYGVVGGTAVILTLLFASLRILLRRKKEAWQGVFLLFFANACQLLTSYTYWHSPALWAALAVGVNYCRAETESRITLPQLRK